jgi:alpha-tubulin suppressor-like RCC1 family protein
LIIHWPQEPNTEEIIFDLAKNNLKPVQMGGGISHMIFLFARKVQNTTKRVVYRFGQDSLGCIGSISSQDTPTEWKITEFDNVDMIGYGGYHTLFLVQGKVFACGYDANGNACIHYLHFIGEFGAKPRGNYYNMVALDHITEPIKYLTCGYFYSVFLTTSNKLLCCGSNESNLLGVNDILNNCGSQVPQIVHLPQFDHIVSKVFVGAMHWFVQTTDDRLYFSGKPISHPRGHLSEIQSNGRFVECKRGVVQKGMDMALGNLFSVVYVSKSPYELFTKRFIRALLDGSEKAITHSDIIIS